MDESQQGVESEQPAAAPEAGPQAPEAPAEEPPAEEPPAEPGRSTAQADANDVAMTSGPPAPAQATEGGRRWRLPRGLLPALVFAVVGVVAAVGATGLYLYNKATEPDRSTPIVSTDAFLNAVFIEHSTDKASLFVCSRWDAAQAVSTMTSNIDPALSVAWGNFLDLQASQTEYRVRLQLRVSAGGSTDIRRWEFVLLRENGGWRVCSARQLPLGETRPG